MTSPPTITQASLAGTDAEPERPNYIGQTERTRLAAAGGGEAAARDEDRKMLKLAIVRNQSRWGLGRRRDAPRRSRPAPPAAALSSASSSAAATPP